MVSELCLGAMTFGREADEPTSRKLIDLFVDSGGNFIDTADVYEAGASEEIVGRVIADRREELVVATKVRFPMAEGVNDVGLSRKHVVAACDASLRRLGTDYIDLYQMHCWDRLTPLEETMSALTDLVRAGKVRYIGASNFTGWQVAKAASVSAAHGFEPLVSLQPQYSLIERNVEREVVPACLDAGLGLIPWGPLGQGFLTGKYRRDEPPPSGTRIGEASEELEEHWSKRATDRNWRTLDALDEIVAESGKSHSQVALRWLLAQPGVVSPIIGARKLDQLDDNLGAAGWELDPRHAARLDEASRLEPLYPYSFIEGAQRG
jgi:aryl-alcohol dehydrogenase-like predicted oxidoreductase